MSPKDDVISTFEKDLGVDLSGNDMEPVIIAPDIVEDVGAGNTEEGVTKEERTPMITDREEFVAEATEVAESAKEVTEAVETPAYVPDYTYSVKGDSREVPEYLRASITSAETEMQVRNMLTKLDGFDGIKASRDETMVRVEEAEKSVKDYSSYLRNINSMLEKRDFDNFFKEARLGEKDILDYAEEILARRELPYEEQVRIKERNDQTRYSYTQQQETSETQRAYEAQTQRLHDLELQVIFSRPDVMAAEKELDARLGAGSFKRTMGEIGNAVYGTKNEMTVMQATEETIRRFGLNTAQVAPATATAKIPIRERVVVSNTGMPVIEPGSGAESVVSRELTPEDLDRMQADAMSGKLTRR